jgi:hypothetical protein
MTVLLGGLRRGVAQPGRAPGSGPGGRRFKSSLPDQLFCVRSGDMGNRTFRRHRLHFWPEGVLQGLQSFLLQINIAKIVIHKTDQPDAIFNFLDTDSLAGKGYAQVDLLVVEAKTPATGDHDGAVVERVVRFGNAAIRRRGRQINLSGAFHRESFMRPFLIELLNKSNLACCCRMLTPAGRVASFFRVRCMRS